jgi:hypothetical protein
MGPRGEWILVAILVALLVAAWFVLAWRLV